jgi:hypothetical protein
VNIGFCIDGERVRGYWESQNYNWLRRWKGGDKGVGLLSSF